MKKDIHPESTKQEIKCSTCDHVHSLKSVANDITIDVCSNCHSFYTGDNTSIKATGRVERFNRMFGKTTSDKKTEEK